jgi:peroxiredoxin
MPALKPGDTAPDFELPVNNRETVRLSSALEQGPVVLLAYVFDFSPG